MMATWTSGLASRNAVANARAAVITAGTSVSSACGRFSVTFTATVAPSGAISRFTSSGSFSATSRISAIAAAVSG